MLQIVEQTYDEKIAMYMQLPKRKLCEMLIQCNVLLDNITPNFISFRGINKRCTYSDKWHKQYRKSPFYMQNRVGNIVGCTRDGRCYQIIWDGTKTKQSYHVSFIKIIEPISEYKIESIS